VVERERHVGEKSTEIGMESGGGGRAGGSLCSGMGAGHWVVAREPNSNARSKISTIFSKESTDIGMEFGGGGRRRSVTEARP